MDTSPDQSSASTSAGSPIRSPLRFAAAATAMIGALSHGVECPAQYHRGIWFGLMYSLVTLGWLTVALLIARLDTRRAWRTGLAVTVASLAVWLVSRAAFATHAASGRWSAPVALVQLITGGCMLGLAGVALRARATEVAIGARRRWSLVAGAAVLVLGAAATGSAAAAGSAATIGLGADTVDMHGMHGMQSGGYWGSVGGDAFHANGHTRAYYIAADEVAWDYAPTGANAITGQPFDSVAKTYTASGAGRIGSKYLKCLYRGYTDASYSQLTSRTPADAYLGFLGPVIRAEVGDTITVSFKNNCDIPASVHPHGVFYTKSSEGAPYADGTSDADKADDAVPHGGTHTYTWLVPERAGPGPHDGSSVMWMYHSHSDEVSDTYAGLMGPMVVTARGQARADGSPKDVDREAFETFAVMNENNSPYLDRNVHQFAQQPYAAADDEEFQESNLMHSINGYVFGNQPMLTLRKGQHVRWYVMDMGTEVDLHTPHWHGNDVVVGGMRMDVVSLLPAGMVVGDMVPDNVGTWLFHCHVNDHLTAGMVTRYQVIS